LGNIEKSIPAYGINIDELIADHNSALEAVEFFNNVISVKAGDIISISAGTKHALLSGTVLEPQIPGTTYRLYDINALGREVQTDEALTVMDVYSVGSRMLENIYENTDENGSNVTVNRWPGDFENKGLAVNSITMKPGKNKAEVIHKINTGIAHSLSLVSGSASIYDANGNKIADMKKIAEINNDGIVTAHNGMYFIPAEVKSFEIRTSSDAVVVDVFTPQPAEDEAVTFKTGSKIEGVENAAEWKVAGVMSDFGTSREMIDTVTVYGNVFSFKEIGLKDDQKVKIIIEEGTLQITGDQTIKGENTFNSGAAIEVAYKDLKNMEVINIGEGPLKFNVKYDQTRSDKAMYASNEALKKNASAIADLQKVIYMGPSEMYSKLGKGTNYTLKETAMIRS
ncbi:MAG: hypothetical protein HQL29_06145, partial [Candidatus Omnitrophica bacterium]|nr:hypothetical protein [Candidatus Omnitrophota bacterium]